MYVPSVLCNALSNVAPPPDTEAGRRAKDVLRKAIESARDSEAQLRAECKLENRIHACRMRIFDIERSRTRQ